MILVDVCFKVSHFDSETQWSHLTSLNTAGGYMFAKGLLKDILILMNATVKDELVPTNLPIIYDIVSSASCFLRNI